LYSNVEIASRNRLLAALTPSDLQLLLPLLKATPLEAKRVLERRHEAIEYVYFVLSGLVSVVGTTRPNHRIEVGMVGCEGMTGLAVVLADGSSANETIVQSAGSALRLPADMLRESMAESRSLSAMLMRYAHVFMMQASQTAVSNGRGVLGERLARWLLMWRDRLNDDNLVITHEFLAILLGVRRPGITDVVHILEGKGLIKSSRSLIRIVNRDGLRKEANGFYGVPEAEYDRLIRTPIPHLPSDLATSSV
jgi:CRP-like cAMP-binding protein